MLYIGIDWATDNHTVTLLARPGEVVESLVIDNTLAGFLALLETVRKHLRKLEPTATPDAVSFAIEDQNQRLTDFLLAQGFQGWIKQKQFLKTLYALDLNMILILISGPMTDTLAASWY